MLVNKNMRLDALIKTHYAGLSPMARSVAHYLQDNPLAVVTHSVLQIAQASNTSKATVSRFFRQLGYASHQDAKHAMLVLRDKGFPIAVPSSSGNFIDAELDQVRKTLEGINAESLAQITSCLSVCKRVMVMGYRTSYPLAVSFCQQLKQIRAGVLLLPTPGQTLSEDIIDVAEDDCVVVMGLRRRPKIFAALIENIKHSQSVLITDPSGQIYAQEVKHTLVCHLGQKQAFDSYAAPMALLSLISNSLYSNLQVDGQTRVSEISGLYGNVDELES